MRRVLGRLFAAIFVVIILVVASCRESGDEASIIPESVTGEVADLNSALSDGAKVVGVEVSTDPAGSMTLELDDGSRCSIAYSENSVYTVSAEGLWQLGAVDVSGSPYSTTLRAQSSADAAPVDGSKGVDLNFEDELLYWVASRSGDGSWVWSPYLADSGELCSSLTLDMPTTPDVIYNSQMGSLILIVGDFSEEYSTQSDDDSNSGDIDRVLVSSEFSWSYRGAVDGGYSFDIEVGYDGTYGLLSAQREGVAGAEPEVWVVDADSGESVDPLIYNFSVDGSGATDSETPYITIKTSNRLDESCNLELKLSYEGLADDGVSALVVTVPVVVGGAPSVVVGALIGGDGSVDITQLGDMPWVWLFGAIESQIEGGEWSGGDYSSISEDIESVLESLSITSNLGDDERLSIVKGDDNALNMAIKIVSEGDYALYTPIVYSDVVLEDSSGFKLTYSGLSLTLYDSNNVIVGLDSGVEPSVVWSYAISSSFEDTTLHPSEWVYSGEGYRVDNLRLDERMTAALYDQIEGVTPEITFSGLGSYSSSDFDFAIEESEGSYYAAVQIRNVLSTTDDLTVVATYMCGDVSLRVQVAISVIGAPIFGSETPVVWSTNSSYRYDGSYYCFGSDDFASADILGTSEWLSGGYEQFGEGSPSTYSNYLSAAVLNMYSDCDEGSLPVSTNGYYGFMSDTRGSEQGLGVRFNGSALSAYLLGLDYIQGSKEVLAEGITVSEPYFKLTHPSGFGVLIGGAKHSSVVFDSYLTALFDGGEVVIDDTNVDLNTLFAIGNLVSETNATTCINFSVVDSSGVSVDGGYLSWNGSSATSVSLTATLTIQERDISDGYFSYIGSVIELHSYDFVVTPLKRADDSVALTPDSINTYINDSALADGPVEIADLSSLFVGDLSGAAETLTLSEVYIVDGYSLSISDGRLMISSSGAAVGDQVEFTDVQLSNAAGVSVTYPSIKITVEVLVSETTASFVWDYATSAAGGSYSATVRVDGSSVLLGSLPDDISGGYVVFNDDTLYYTSATVTLSDYTPQNDGSYRVTIEVSNCDMAMSSSSDLFILWGDAGNNAFSIPTTITGAPTASCPSDVEISIGADILSGEQHSTTLSDICADLNTAIWSGGDAPYSNVSQVATQMVVTSATDADYTLSNAEGSLIISYSSTAAVEKIFENVVLTHTSGFTLTYPKIKFEVTAVPDLNITTASDTSAEFLWLYAQARQDTPEYTAKIELDQSITESIINTINNTSSPIAATAISLTSDTELPSGYDQIETSLNLSYEQSKPYATVTLKGDKLITSANELTLTATYTAANKNGDVKLSIPVTITGAPSFGAEAPLSLSYSCEPYSGFVSHIFGSDIITDESKLPASTEWKTVGYKQFGAESATDYTAITAALAGVAASYNPLVSSNNEYFYLENETPENSGSEGFGITAILNTSKISETLLDLEYSNETNSRYKALLDRDYDGLHTPESCSNWISGNGNFIMKDDSGFSIQVGSLAFDTLNFDSYMEANFSDDIATIPDYNTSLDDLYTLRNAVAGGGSSTAITYEVGGDSAVTIDPATNSLILNEDYRTQIPMCATLQITLSTGDLIKIHKEEFTLNVTKIAEDNTPAITPSTGESTIYWDYNAAASGEYSIEYTTTDLSTTEITTIQSATADITTSGTALAASEFAVSVDGTTVTLTIKSSLATAESGVVVTATYPQASDKGVAVILNFGFDIAGAPAYTNVTAESINTAKSPTAIAEGVEIADLKSEFSSGDLSSYAADIAAELSLETAYTNNGYALSVSGGRLILTNSGAETDEIAEFSNVVLMTASGITLTYPSIKVAVEGVVTQTTATLIYNSTGSYSATVRVDSSSVSSGSLPEDISGGFIMFDDAAATVTLSDYTLQSDGSYRVTIDISGCSIAVSDTPLSILYMDMSGNIFTIPVMIVSE